MNAVRLIQDEDISQVGDDFLRVSCHGDEATGVFTIIERVLCPDCAPQNTGRWRLRKLFDGLLTSKDAAMKLAMAYARHKGIPVVFTETHQH